MTSCAEQLLHRALLTESKRFGLLPWLQRGLIGRTGVIMVNMHGNMAPAIGELVAAGYVAEARRRRCLSFFRITEKGMAHAGVAPWARQLYHAVIWLELKHMGGEALEGMVPPY